MTQNGDPGIEDITAALLSAWYGMGQSILTAIQEIVEGYDIDVSPLEEYLDVVDLWTARPPI